MLRLKLFGTPAVESSGKTPSRLICSRKQLAVLALLAAGEESGPSRDSLRAFLWPEASHAKAAHALNQLLHVLRRDLGTETLCLGSSDLRLNPEHVTSDLGEFRDAWRRAELQRAVSLYSGPFLDGFFLRDAPVFERWVESERAKLARVYSGALRSLAVEAAARGDHQRVAKWWRRLADQAPLRLPLDAEMLWLRRDRPGAYRRALANDALLRVGAYIDDHIDERISLDELARQAGVSRSHFSRQFRLSTGESPMGYLRRIRIERSKTILQTRATTIAAVAARLGFSDQSHFTRIFRRVVGMPPGAYARWDESKPRERTGATRLSPP